MHFSFLRSEVKKKYTIFVNKNAGASSFNAWNKYDA